MHDLVNLIRPLLPWTMRAAPARTALARVGGPAGQPVDDQPRGFRRQPQAEVASTPHAISGYLVLADVSGCLIGEYVVDNQVTGR